MPPFQYISCCSLSIKAAVPPFPFGSFNTSHVVVYQSSPHNSYTVHKSFNTSHVVVYRPGRGKLKTFRSQFQYISCCSLSDKQPVPAVFPFLVSIHLMLQFIHYQLTFIQQLSSFNTSHVVVYLDIQPAVKLIANVSIHLMLQFIGKKFNIMLGLDKFQYISCCSLSSYNYMFYKDGRMFQYISCCSLSDRTV